MSSNLSAEVAGILARIRGLSVRAVRGRERCFWVEGVREFVQAVDGGMVFEAVVISPILLKSDLCEMLARRLRATGVKRVKVSPEEFRRVSGAQRASGIGGIVRQRWSSLEKFSSDGFYVVMEEIRSVGNLGTILRTAEACGASGVIFVGSACDPFDAGTVRGSMGGVFHIRMARTTAGQLRAWGKRCGVCFVGLTVAGEKLWTEIPRAGKVGILIGEERRGLSAEMEAVCEVRVRLPMVGRADSLNVGVAAGVMMYEVVRGRGI